MTPFVSVIIPVRNGERTIAACLDSVLAQDYPKDRYEIIVVDNDSTDRTADCIRQHPAVQSLAERKAHSPAAARNRGIRAAQGEILALIDADCIATPGWLRAGVAGFAEAGIGCVAGEIVAAKSETVAERYVTWKSPFPQRHAVSESNALSRSVRPFAQTLNAFYRRQVFERVGLFDPGLMTGEDADLSWRMQHELGWTIAYRSDAVVAHQHRSSIHALLKQRRGYGYGSVLLYRKYRQQMEPWTIKHTYWETRALLRKYWTFTRACASSAAGCIRGRPCWEPVLMASLDVAAYLSWKLGQVQGSLRHRVWYL